MVSGGKRLFNHISFGLSYQQPLGEVRLVSHVFSSTAHRLASTSGARSKVFATVMTYTSRNELVTFDVVASSQQAKKPGSTVANRRHLVLSDGEVTTAEEQAMIDLVLRSSDQG